LQAAEDSLHRLYLTRTPASEVALPSETFTSLDADVYASDVDWAGYAAPALGEQEVMYASAGRSAIVLDEGVRERLADA
jgi:large subunit ribosomal protein L44